MMKSPKNIETWLQKHRRLGIAHFYLRLEDSPEIATLLSNQRDITLTQGKSEGINEYENQQTRQQTMVDGALRQAEQDGHCWLVHIDSDEILVGDLNELRSLPPTIKTVWMQNYEAKFPKVPTNKDNCFVAKRMVDCSREHCVAYVNGKGAGRCESDVFGFGPHRFRTTAEKGKETEYKCKNLVVHHFESCDFYQYRDKFKRLAKQDRVVSIPFPYYRESITTAKTNDDEQMRQVYSKYRVEQSSD